MSETKCAACGASCRKTRLALVLPENRTRRVCTVCSTVRGLLVVPTLVPTPPVKVVTETHGLDLCEQQVRAWLSLAHKVYRNDEGAPVRLGGHDVLAARIECYEQFLQLVARARDFR